MEYRKFSQEQLDRAKNADLIAFLSAYMGLEFKRAGKYYQCKQHSSLVIYSDRKGFVWNSQNISGLTMMKQDGRQPQSTRQSIRQEGAKYILFSAEEKM